MVGEFIIRDSKTPDTYTGYSGTHWQDAVHGDMADIISVVEISEQGVRWCWRSASPLNRAPGHGTPEPMLFEDAPWLRQTYHGDMSDFPIIRFDMDLGTEHRRHTVRHVRYFPWSVAETVQAPARVTQTFPPDVVTVSHWARGWAWCMGEPYGFTHLETRDVIRAPRFQTFSGRVIPGPETEP